MSPLSCILLARSYCWAHKQASRLTPARARSGRQLAPIFLQLPPQEQYPDYYALITRPVSFQLVRVRPPSHICKSRARADEVGTWVYSRG